MVFVILLLSLLRNNNNNNFKYIQKVEFDRPGERRPEYSGLLLLLTVTDVSTTRAVVIFRVKVSCITSVDGIILWLLI